MPAFFDTNTLLYFASGEPRKAECISTLFPAGGWIGVQVLNEATRVMRDKWKAEWPAIHAVLDDFRILFHVAPLDLETHRIGLDIAEHYKLGIFDSMIVAAALIAGCDTLYSEDMHHGLLIERQLTIINPFRDLSA